MNHRNHYQPTFIGISALVAAGLMPTVVHAQSVDPHFEKIDFAHGLFQRGLYEMAAGEYQQFIDKFADSDLIHEAYFGLAESYFFEEQFQQAADVFRTYVTQFPNRDKINLAKIRLGQSLQQLQKFDEALAAANEIPDDGLDQQWIQNKYLLLAQIYKTQGNHDQAIANYQKVEEIAKDSPTAIETYIKLGESHKEKADYPTAIAYFQKAIDFTKDDKVKSLALYKQAEIVFLMEEYHDSADLFAQVVDLQADPSMVEDAISNLLLALFNVPAYNAVISRYEHYKSQLTPQGRQFDADFVLARSYKLEGQFDAALEAADRALAIPDISAANRNKAVDTKVEVLFLSKRYESVIQLIDSQWTDQTEYRAKALFFKAESHYSLGRFEEAHNYYETLLAEYPETEFKEEATYGLAHAKNALGKETEAADLFKQYFASADDDEKKKEALYNQILLHSKLNKVEQGIADAEQYLNNYAEDSKRGIVMFLLGNLYSKQNRYDDAIRMFQQIVDHDPTNPKRQDSTFLLAYNLQLKGDIPKALEYYALVPQNPEDPTLYYSARKNMALIHLEQENFPKAVLILKEIITSYEENDLTIDMYLWLAEKTLEAKSYDAVISVLNKAEGKQKTDDDRQAVAFFKATAHQKQSECDQAIPLYDTVIGIQNDSLFIGQSLIGKSQCLIEQKDYAAAKQVLDQVLLDFGDDDKISLLARFEMGHLLELKGKPEDAAKFYMLVAVLYNDTYYCPEALFRAGQIFEQTKNIKNARNVYQEIIQLYMNSHRFSEAQKRLAAIAP